MNCPTCGIRRSTPKDERLKQTLNEAKRQAIEHYETKAICRSADGSYYTTSYEGAIASYAYIVEVVSKYP